MIELIENHRNEIIINKEGFDRIVIRHASAVLYNIGNFGFHEAKENEKNVFRKSFDEVDGVNRMYELFQFLSTHMERDKNKNGSEDETEKKTIDYISITICYLLKSDILPLSYGNLIIHLYNLKSLPSPSSGFNFPLFARAAWNGMVI
jgi:hypothetical protein